MAKPRKKKGALLKLVGTAVLLLSFATQNFLYEKWNARSVELTSAMRDRSLIDKGALLNEVVRFEIGSLSKGLNRFAMKEYQFGAHAETNDMWLELNLGDNKFEKALVDYVGTLLAQHYKPFSRVNVDEHC
jgi:hypothetical protein